MLGAEPDSAHDWSRGNRMDPRARKREIDQVMGDENEYLGRWAWRL